MGKRRSRRSIARKKAASDAERDLDVVRSLRLHHKALRNQNELLREMQQAIENSRDRYRDLFESAPVTHVVTDHDGIIEEMNLTGARLLAAARDALIGVPLFTLAVEADRRHLLDEFDRCRASADASSIRVRLRTTAGRAIPVQLTMLGDGKRVRIAAYDASESSRVEEERERIELERRRVERRAALVAAAGEAKDRFLSMLSHELRTPLGPILTAATVLLETPALAPEASSLVRMIRRNAVAEARLVDDLLDVSRIEHGRLELRLETVDVHDVIREAVAQLGFAVAPAPLPVQVALNARRHHVRGDAIRLHQVLSNLLGNARRNSPESTPIVVLTTDGPDDQIRISIRDSGAGIDPELLPYLFTPFMHVATCESDDPRHSTGLGLGLAICKGIVDAHGGTIQAISDGIGRGATFEIRLGVQAEVATPQAGSAEPPPAAVEPRALPPSLRILLVEDHEDSASSLALFLRMRQHEVTVARSVAEAVARADTAHDVLICDLDLPDGTGYELLARIRERRPPAAIALSGFGSSDMVLQSSRAGFDDHLVKPVDLATLLQAVARTLHNGADASGTKPSHSNDAVPSKDGDDRRT